MKLRELLRRHLVEPLVGARGSPTSIARGAALGMWIAFTPTIGIQMFAVGILGIPLRANIPVALALVWLSNPVTMVPIYFAFYYVGTLVLAQPRLSYEMLTDRLGFALQTARGEDGLWAGLADLFRFLGWEVAWPMAVGSFIVATALAVPTYHGVLLWARRRRIRVRREQRAAVRVQGRSEGPPGTGTADPAGPGSTPPGTGATARPPEVSQT